MFGKNIISHGLQGQVPCPLGLAGAHRNPAPTACACDKIGGSLIRNWQKRFMETRPRNAMGKILKYRLREMV